MVDLAAKIDCGCQTVGHRLAELEAAKILKETEIQEKQNELDKIEKSIACLMEQ